jgi:hypothetical protein
MRPSAVCSLKPTSSWLWGGAKNTRREREMLCCSVALSSFASLIQSILFILPDCQPVQCKHPPLILLLLPQRALHQSHRSASYSNNTYSLEDVETQCKNLELLCILCTLLPCHPVTLLPCRPVSLLPCCQVASNTETLTRNPLSIFMTYDTARHGARRGEGLHRPAPHREPRLRTGGRDAIAETHQPGGPCDLLPAQELLYEGVKGKHITYCGILTYCD